MASLRKVVPLALGIALTDCSSVLARHTFHASEIDSQGAEIIFCDLDGDGLKDAVLVDGLIFSVFYQGEQGFTLQPQLQHHLEERPAVLWLGRLGRKSESLLMMTSEGVSELRFTDRTGPPVGQVLLKQQTIIPVAVDESQVMWLPFAVGTATGWPLLLVPATEGLQVWEHREAWRKTQVLAQAIETHLRPSVANPGYTESFGLSLSLGDVNADGREDLIVRRKVPGGQQTYALYLQLAGGRFTPEPELTYTEKADLRTALCWVDVNRDGRADLIRSTMLEEPSFVPGMPSGKVLVGVYLADDRGRIPAVPQQVFRKNDWSSSIPVVDVDGDGFVDLVLGYIPVNTREGLRKIVTAEQIDLSLRLYCYRRGAGFPKDQDCQRDTVLHFDREFFFTPERRLYYEQFVNLFGDFNGDGKKDLLVRDRSGGISVYYFVSRMNGFSAEADLRFSCPEPIEWWEVRDLNGDRVSDLIVRVRKRNAFRVFASQSQ